MLFALPLFFVNTMRFDEIVDKQVDGANGVM